MPANRSIEVGLWYTCILRSESPWLHSVWSDHWSQINSGQESDKQVNEDPDWIRHWCPIRYEFKSIVGDAFIHLIPHSFGTHEEEESTDNENTTNVATDEHSEDVIILY